MVAKKGKKAGKKVKSLGVKSLSAEKTKSVKGGALNAYKPQEQSAANASVAMQTWWGKK